MAKQKKILNDDAVQRINKLLRSCAETADYLGQCKGCHLDVDREIDTNEEQQRIAAAIKRTFAPDSV